MGVRCEVFFHDLYHDVPLFDDVLRIMTEHGFILANLAYSGKGTHQSFFCPGERWGMLTACEAVFIKNPLTMQEISPLAMLKFLIFCLKNDLPDVAYKFIEDNLSKFELARNELEKRKVFAYLDLLFQHATNKLKYAPGTSFQLAVGAYRRFFGKSYLDLHNFNESLHLNP
jgi:hypothetical protein